jgi:hypothetical protein
MGFTHLPGEYYPILAGLVVTYLALVEGLKGRFYRLHGAAQPLSRRRSRAVRRVHRRASPFSRRRRVRH